MKENFTIGSAQFEHLKVDHYTVGIRKTVIMMVFTMMTNLKPQFFYWNKTTSMMEWITTLEAISYSASGIAQVTGSITSLGLGL